MSLRRTGHAFHPPHPHLGRRKMSDLFEPQDAIERDAVLSDCGRYRYLLRRAWDHTKPRALFVMLNPSTADAKVDDATIRSCIRLCKSWGYGSFEVCNLYGWRSTDPDALNVGDMPMMIGEKNADVMDAAIGRCDVVICAWGAHASARLRQQAVCSTVKAMKPAVYCLGKTKSGAPKHPLYIKTGTPLEVYQP